MGINYEGANYKIFSNLLNFLPLTSKQSPQLFSQTSSTYVLPLQTYTKFYT